MKTPIYILLCIFLFIGCNKEKIEETAVSEISVLMNGAPWVHDEGILNNAPPNMLNQIGAFWDIIGGDSTVNISMTRTNTPNVEDLSFFRVPFKTGEYQLIPNRPGVHVDNTVKTRFSTLIGGDAGGGIYNLLPSEDNFLTIKSIDRTLNIIGGEFQGIYIDGGDTLRFTDGVFRTSIIHYLSDQ